jgi:hypothetical protein
MSNLAGKIGIRARDPTRDANAAVVRADDRLLKFRRHGKRAFDGDTSDVR